MSNEAETTTGKVLFRAGSSCGDGKGLIVAKARSRLGNLKSPKFISAVVRSTNLGADLIRVPALRSGGSGLGDI
jgi:hypothetical protein